jgi:hypothetical protein
MAKYKQTNIVSKNGINFIRSLVEKQGCLFHKIEQENDFGIDALIELFRKGRPLNRQFAIQIKSGQSYYNARSCECLIPVGNHFDYWTAYQLPLFGAVYVPSLDRAYWINIKSYLKNEPSSSTIRFAATEANRLDSATFQSIFLPILLNETPEIELKQAFALLHSKKPDESYLGLIVLFRRFSNLRETWTALIDYFKSRDFEAIPPILIYYFAHIPWHPDIAYVGEAITPETKAYAKSLLHEFGRDEVLKLLAFIDKENMIARGTIGQSVEAVVSFLPNIDKLLEGIANDAAVHLQIREFAALILSMHLGKAALPILHSLVKSGSWYSSVLITYLQQYGAIDPYG